MTTDASHPTLTHGPSDGEILRLRQQLEAREEVIRQLNQLVIDHPASEFAEPPEPDQDQLADAVAGTKALQAEVNRLNQVIEQKDVEIAALRRHRQVAESVEAPASVPGASRARALLRRVRSK
jgi:hypothetical protein